MLRKVFPYPSSDSLPLCDDSNFLSEVITNSFRVKDSNEMCVVKDHKVIFIYLFMQRTLSDHGIPLLLIEILVLSLRMKTVFTNHLM